MTEMSLFDFLPEEEAARFKPQKSDDWKWKFADYPKEKNGLKVFSCFACGGGSTMGYKLAGCEVLGCCEIDPKMNDIYLSNHHPKYNFLMDIRDFNEMPIEKVPNELFNIDILDGSPPCTTFSMAGSREESWGKKKKFREGQKEQTLDDLSFVFIETVKRLLPKVVIMENVEGLILGEAFGYVQKIYKKFEEAGYKICHWLMKGEKMGIPQTRHRVFFVAIREDLQINPEKLNMSFNYEPVTYGQIKEGHGKEVARHTKDYEMLCKAIPGDTDIGAVYERLGEKGRRFSARICWDDRVLPTIVAKLFHYRPQEKERISPMDVIHAQTFPEDYDFKSESYLDIDYICGMSVPPVMMKRIVVRLIDEGVFDYKLKAEAI